MTGLAQMSSSGIAPNRNVCYGSFSGSGPLCSPSGTGVGVSCASGAHGDRPAEEVRPAPDKVGPGPQLRIGRSSSVDLTTGQNISGPRDVAALTTVGAGVGHGVVSRDGYGERPAGGMVGCVETPAVVSKGASRPPVPVRDRRPTKAREQLVLAPHMTPLADVRAEAVIAGPVVRVPPAEPVDD